MPKYHLKPHEAVGERSAKPAKRSHVVPLRCMMRETMETPNGRGAGLRPFPVLWLVALTACRAPPPPPPPAPTPPPALVGAPGPLDAGAPPPSPSPPRWSPFMNVGAAP